MRTKVNDANDLLSSFGLGRPIPLNAVMDAALHGIVIPDIPSVEVCLFGGCATIWPSIPIPDIPGMCSYVPVLKDTSSARSRTTRSTTRCAPSTPRR